MENEQMELLRRMEEKLDYLEKRQKRQQLRSIIAWCLVLAVVIAAAVYVVPKVKRMAEQYDYAMAQVEKVSKAFEGVDMDKLASSLSTIDMDKLKEAVDGVAKIDMDAVSEGVTKLNDAMKKLEKLDLDTIMEKLNLLSEKIEPLMKLFG